MCTELEVPLPLPFRARFPTDDLSELCLMLIRNLRMPLVVAAIVLSTLRRFAPEHL